MDKPKTLYEELASTKTGRIELAAARAQNTAGALLYEAFANSGKTIQEIAETLGITTSRAEDILSGDINYQLATIARFLEALDYDLILEAKEKD